MSTTSPFTAVAHRTRRQILDLLLRRPLPAGELASRFRGVSRPAISKHLSVLRRARLVAVRRRGRERIYSLRPERLGAIGDWLRVYEKYWDRQLASLQSYLEEE
jgi:DNA-binding transcriptional ArsR family regulator